MSKLESWRLKTLMIFYKSVYGKPVVDLYEKFSHIKEMYILDTDDLMLVNTTFIIVDGPSFDELANLHKLKIHVLEGHRVIRMRFIGHSVYLFSSDDISVEGSRCWPKSESKLLNLKLNLLDMKFTKTLDNLTFGCLAKLRI